MSNKTESEFFTLYGMFSPYNYYINKYNLPAVDLAIIIREVLIFANFAKRTNVRIQESPEKILL